MSTRVSSSDVSAWLRRETPEHMKLVSRLREKLSSTLESDVNEFGTPSRDWARAFSRYQVTYQMLEQAERERWKLRLALKRAGEPILDDDEYNGALQELAVEALGTLPADALLKEIERRGLLQAASEDDNDAH